MNTTKRERDVIGKKILYQQLRWYEYCDEYSPQQQTILSDKQLDAFKF